MRLACLAIATAALSIAAAPELPSHHAAMNQLYDAKDWGGLVTELAQPKDPVQQRQNLSWLETKTETGASFLIALSYANYLWQYGEMEKVDDPKTDLRVEAAMISLYVYELILIDGAACQDYSAPQSRFDQYVSQRRDTLRFIKTLTPEWQEKIVDQAIALEKQTAPRREPLDEILCRGGMDEMMAGLEAGKTEELPPQPGYVGKQVGVSAPPGWKPKFLPAGTYLPVQAQKRAQMRDFLLKVIANMTAPQK